MALEAHSGKNGGNASSKLRHNSHMETDIFAYTHGITANYRYQVISSDFF